MSGQGHQHLSDDEIEYCLSAAQNKDTSLVSDRLAECLTCRKRVEMHRSAKDQLEALRQFAPVDSSPSCPAHRSWIELAARSLEPAETTRLELHAALCEQCRARMNEAVLDLSRPLDDDELRSLEAEGLLTPSWLPDLPERLALASAGQQSARRRANKRLTLVWAAAAGLASILAGSWWWWDAHYSTAAAARLIASAYTQRRNVELRIPAAHYSDLRMDRGRAASSFGRPRDLIDAESLIAGRLASRPNDPDWLVLKGWADLLAWDYESAIAVLKRALELRPDSPDILDCLGSAYFERAESTANAADFGTAIEFYSQALRSRPNDRIALYNRALTSERIFLFNRAAADWERLLAIEPSGEWAAQVRAHIQGQEKKNDPH